MHESYDYKNSIYNKPLFVMGELLRIGRYGSNLCTALYDCRYLHISSHCTTWVVLKTSRLMNSITNIFRVCYTWFHIRNLVSRAVRYKETTLRARDDALVAGQPRVTIRTIQFLTLESYLVISKKVHGALPPHAQQCPRPTYTNG
jgi:hypothetical protein